MTKRFIPLFDGTDKKVIGAKDNGQIISFMDVFDLLNQLNDENKQLKEWMKDLKHEYDSLHDVCSKLELFIANNQEKLEQKINRNQIKVKLNMEIED